MGRMKAVFGILAVLINLLYFVPYITEVVQRKIKPQRIAWATTALLSSIVFANQSINGGGWSAYLFGSTALMSALIFMLSIQNGVGKANRDDKIFMVCTVLLFLFWIIRHETHATTVLALIIEALAFAPMIRKTVLKPKSEAYPQWVLGALAGLFCLLALPKTDTILLLYPLYTIVMNGLIMGAKRYSETKKV